MDGAEECRSFEQRHEPCRVHADGNVLPVEERPGALIRRQNPSFPVEPDFGIIPLYRPRRPDARLSFGAPDRP